MPVRMQPRVSAGAYYPSENTLHNTVNTAVPFAAYRLKFHDSPRHGLQKLYLCDVPHRSGILIHAGNTPAGIQITHREIFLYITR